MPPAHAKNLPNQATQVDIAVIGTFAAICGVVVSLAALSQPDMTGQLALVYPPWTSGSESLTRASASGADLVGLGRYPFIVIVALRSPGQASDIRDSGAILTLAANGFGGCLKASTGVPA